MMRGNTWRSGASIAVVRATPGHSHVVRAAIVTLVLALAAGCRAREPQMSAAEAVQRGDVFMQKQQYAEAISVYQLALKDNPTNGDLRLKLTNAHRLAQHWNEATLEAVRAADSLPENTEAQLTAVELLIATGRFVDAIDRIQPVLRAGPSARALVLYANAKAHLGYSAVALVTISEAWRTKRDAEAVRLHFRPATAQSDDRQAESALRQAIQIDPTVGEARWALANLLWATGRFDEGAEILQPLAKADRGSALWNRALGLFHWSRGRLADAERYLQVAAATMDPESRLILSEFYIATKRDEQALAILNEIGTSNVSDTSVALQAADVELRLGRHEQALQRAEQVLAREPRNAIAIRRKGEALLAGKRFDQALQLARDSTLATPNSSDAHALLGRSLRAVGDPAGAFDELAEGLRLDPGNAEIPKELAELALELGRDKIALDFARQTVRLHPGDHNASLTLVKALIRTRDLMGADQALSPLLSQDGASPDELVLLATIQAGRGSREAARTSYTRALQASRESFEALSGLVELELSDRQLGKASQLVGGAVGDHPGDSRYLLLAARVAKAQGNMTATEAHLRAALALDPAQVEGALLFAELAPLNRRDEARQVVERALAGHPSSVALQTSRAILLEESGMIPEARTRYSEILSAHPDAHAVSARLAVLYANQNEQLDTALALASTAKQRSPDDPLISDALGWVFVRKGLPALGLPHLRDAIRDEPAKALFRYHLGIAYQGLQQLTQAREELNRALQLDPQFSAAKAALAELVKDR